MSEVGSTLRARNKGTRRETKVTKRLSILRSGVVDDPIETIVGDILMVHAINGHIASVQEIEEELRAIGRLGPVDSDINQIRSAVASRIRATERATDARSGSVDGTPARAPRTPSVQDLEASSPYDLCLMYSEGDLLENDLIRRLRSFAYGMPPSEGLGRREPDSPSAWQEIEDALADKLIERGVYAILRENHSATHKPGRPAH
jgi:hypothetical protein